MFSLLVILVVLGLLIAVGASAVRTGVYPDRIHYGGFTVEFSSLDRVCYGAAAIAVVVGVAAGVVLIWSPQTSDALGKIAGTAGLVFAGAVLVLVLNRLMRGRGSP